MKNTIVLCAVVVFLMIFPIMYGLEQHNHKNMSQFHTIVNAHKEIAKADGYFKPENIASLRNEILAEFKEVENNEIVIDVTTTPKYRKNEFDERELIHYRIGVPIKKIIACSSFWGISDADNQLLYEIDRTTTSELLTP